jgi:nucleoside-diphosphate-sugar epimerase
MVGRNRYYLATELFDALRRRVQNGLPPFCFPATLVRRWLNGEEVVLYTPDREHDFLYVHALADLIVKALSPGPHWNDIYNVVGPPRSLWTFVETAQAVVERHTGRPARILRQPGPMPRLPLASTAKLASRLAPVRQPSDAWILGAMVAASIAEQARVNPVREAPSSLPSFPGNP